MPRIARTTKPTRPAREKTLAHAELDADDSRTPQNVDLETSNVRSRAGRATTQPVYNYGGAKTNSAYQIFADALRAAMIKNKLTASEVARRVWGTTKDRRGYEVARNRDRIGHYLAGTSYPEPDNLVKLADAIGVPVEELKIERQGLGPRPRATQGTTNGTLNMSQVPDQPEKIRLQADRVIGWKLAAKIFELLKEAELAEVEAQAGAAAELEETARELSAYDLSRQA